MSDDKHQILKGIVKGLGQLGEETAEKAAEQTGKVFESIITGKELLGLESTMSPGELDFKRRQDELDKEKEIKKLKGEFGQPQGESKDKRRDVENEMEELRRKEEREEEEKERYYEKQKEQRRMQEEQQMAEYNSSLMMESTNPAKQKKSRGSAMAHKKKSQPDTSQMSQTQEFNKGGKID
jgi:hypothetical protein